MNSARDSGEAYLARWLGQFGRVFAGVTDRELRKQRIREAIRAAVLGWTWKRRRP